ncbi:MAG: hypothetical protein PHX10_00310 [Gallionellaceae bacterium]|nr:hypothetical protein [Gallionellaceae bacterium]
MTTAEPYRKVLLVLSSDLPSGRVLDAACALCDRMGAGLEIVGLGEALSAELLDATVREVAHSGLSCRAVAKPDWGVEDLVDWANSRACVATVMLSATAKGVATEEGQVDADGWRRLSCPLVVVGRESIDEQM